MQAPTPDYGSADLLTSPQTKRLITIGASLAPTDTTKGFGQWLIDGEFDRALRELFEKKRMEWRAKYSHLEYIDSFVIPRTFGGRLRDHLFTTSGPSIKYTGSTQYAYSCKTWNSPETAEDSVAFFYRATDRVELARMVECLGGENWFSNPAQGSPNRQVLTPIQVTTLIDEHRLDQFIDKPVLFLIGQYNKRPLFLQASCADGAYHWEICEDLWNQHSWLVEGDIVVVPRPIF